MASAVLACVLLQLGGLPADGRKSVSDRGCERPLRERATPLPAISGQVARHVHNDFALSTLMNRVSATTVYDRGFLIDHELRLHNSHRCSKIYAKLRKMISVNYYHIR